jgi:hypothetical protein
MHECQWNLCSTSNNFSTEECQSSSTPEGLLQAQSSSWINCEIFMDWFEQFVCVTKPSASDPVLLIVDGHNSYTRNLHLIVKARDVTSPSFV